MNAFKALTICAAAATAAVPAAAQDLEVTSPLPSVEVSFGDLNIGSDQGRLLLDARLRGAARQLCQPKTMGPLGERMERRACYRTALDGARTKVRQALFEYARTRMAGPATITVAAR